MGQKTIILTPTVSGGMEAYSSVYPPTGNFTSYGTLAERSRDDALDYRVGVACFRFDTSALPPTVTLQSATLRFTPGTVRNLNAHSLTADWYDCGPDVGLSDQTNTAGTNAHAGTSLSLFTTSTPTSIALINLSNIVRPGFTGVRLHISDGKPTSWNDIMLNSVDLAVTYTVADGYHMII